MYHSFCSRDVLQYEAGLKFIIILDQRLALVTWTWMSGRLWALHRLGSIGPVAFLLQIRLVSFANCSAIVYKVDNILLVYVGIVSGEWPWRCASIFALSSQSHWQVMSRLIDDTDSSTGIQYFGPWFEVENKQIDTYRGHQLHRAATCTRVHHDSAHYCGEK